MLIRVVTKNKQSRGSESISVTNKYLCSKNYLSVFKIVPVEMESSRQFIAIAMLRGLFIGDF